MPGEEQAATAAVPSAAPPAAAAELEAFAEAILCGVSHGGELWELEQVAGIVGKGRCCKRAPTSCLAATWSAWAGVCEGVGRGRRRRQRAVLQCVRLPCWLRRSLVQWWLWPGA